LLVTAVLLSCRCPAASGHSGDVLSAWTATAPTIDGTIGGAEWASADTESFSMFGNPATIYVMNDANNLYIALVINDGTPGDADDIASFYFDNDHDGTGPEKGDNAFEVYNPGAPGYIDYYYETDGFPFNGWAMDTIDLPVGTIDGAGDASFDATYNYFEISFPLDSADDLHDFSLSIGDTVGFTLGCFDDTTDTSVYWPTVFTNPEGYGDIIIASPPAPPKPVGGEVFSVDKLALLAPYIATILVVTATGAAIIKRRRY